MADFFVEIVEYETGDVVKRMSAGPRKSRAEKMDRGVNINLNHKRFYTRIVEASK